MEIIKIVATRCQISILKCTKSFVGWGFAPDPAGGAYSAPPAPLAGFKGPTSMGGERKEGERGGKERKKEEGGEGRGGRERKGTPTLKSWLRHCCFELIKIIKLNKKAQLSL